MTMAWPDFPSLPHTLFDVFGIPNPFLSLLGYSALLRTALHCLALHWRIGVVQIILVAICNLQFFPFLFALPTHRPAPHRSVGFVISLVD